jgi:catechol 2,3-dioxygenase-like lactoylglutathione lyase family enzyme
MATLRSFPSSELISNASVESVDMKFEVLVIPVADVDRSKEFYSKLGWRLDADFPFDNGFRVVQFTPPLTSSRGKRERRPKRQRVRQGPHRRPRLKAIMK